MYAYKSERIIPIAGERLFALLDSAIDPTAYQRIARWLTPYNHVKLFSGTFANSAEAYSPVLIDLEMIGDGQSVILQNLLSAFTGMPALSFLSANSNLHKIAEHLRELLIVETADGQEFHLRYADIRMLPAIFSVLTTAQKNAFMGPISQWLAADHCADMLTLVPDKLREKKIKQFPLRLDEQQLAQLLERTEIHSLVSQLEAMHQPFIRNFTPGARVALIERSIGHARRLGIENSDDVLAWCFYAVRYGERFYSHDRVMPLLESAREEEGTLFASLAQLSEDQWELISSFRGGNELFSVAH